MPELPTKSESLEPEIRLSEVAVHPTPGGVPQGGEPLSTIRPSTGEPASRRVALDRAGTKLNLLIAYPFWNDKVTSILRSVHREDYRLIIDSGAWSAYNSGLDITLDGYCRFLDSVSEFAPFHAVQLDVFGDAEKTWRNFLEMQRRGYDVMPVFTRGESLERLREMYSIHPYIMFGGIASGGGGKSKAYIRYVVERNRDIPMHWLGFTNTEFVKHYRPKSADSSSWMPSRFGQIHVYEGYGKVVSHQKTEFANKPSDKTWHDLMAQGAEPWMIHALQRDRSWRGAGYLPTKDNTYGCGAFLSGLAHIKRAYDVDKALGTHFYFATPTTTWLESLLTSVEYRRSHFNV